MAARDHLSPHQFKMVTSSLTNTHHIQVYHPDFKGGTEPVGEMNWNRGSGKIGNIRVDKGKRRQGIATMMFNHAQTMNPPAKHAPMNEISPAGKKWRRSVGGKSIYE